MLKNSKVLRSLSAVLVLAAMDAAPLQEWSTSSRLITSPCPSEDRHADGLLRIWDK